MGGLFVFLFGECACLCDYCLSDLDCVIYTVNKFTKLPSLYVPLTSSNTALLITWVYMLWMLIIVFSRVTSTNCQGGSEGLNTRKGGGECKIIILHICFASCHVTDTAPNLHSFERVLNVMLLRQCVSVSSILCTGVCVHIIFV